MSEPNADFAIDDALAIDEHVKQLREAGDFAGEVAFWSESPGLYQAVHDVKGAAGLPARNPGPDPARATEKYMRNTAAATGDYVYGMQNPRRNPKQAALAAAGKWANRVQQAIQRDSFRKGVGSYDEAAALQAATSDGGGAYAAGIQKRGAKIAAAFQRVIPAIAAVSGQVQQMPQDNEAQRTQRMVRNLELMRQVGERLRG
jgi:hypothetical protein